MKASILSDSILHCLLLIHTAAVMMYAFADLRSLERKGRLHVSDQSLLQLPVTAGDVFAIVQENLEPLKKEIGTDVEMYLSSLESIKESWKHRNAESKSSGKEGDESTLIVFDDDMAHSELVYGIGVNHCQRRITVAFRGSVTMQDFFTDAKALLTQVAGPAGQSMGIHHGFYDYLLGSKKRRDGGNKYADILEQVIKLQVKYEGYRLYVTGHSLGAALATLFAVQAAGDTRVNGKTISCVGVASPRVGNMAFRRAAQSLEKDGRLRCLRVANHKDLVTLLPDRGSFSCAYILCCQGNVYRHVGVELKLYNGSSGFHVSCSESAEDSYCKVLARDWWRQVRNAVKLVITLPFCCCRDDFLKYHGCREYMERLLRNEKELKTKQLNDLYQQSAYS